MTTIQTLLLTPWFVPHKIISWQTAITLSFLGKVEVLETYEDEIRSPSVTLRAPAVVRLMRHPGAYRRSVKFSRNNVFIRDEFRCQYCGAKRGAGELTYDHVIPRVQGGKTVWENIVAACRPCNARKRGRTPEQAGMMLLHRPAMPRRLPSTPIASLTDRRLPDAWTNYCIAS
jgi:5-methylcytosine-specific restriction endonuclease McrA